MQSVQKTKTTLISAALIISLLLSFCSSRAQGAGRTLQSKATWIWYPGDYEIWLSNQMQNRRTDRGSFFPVFWKMDSHYVLMDFHKESSLQQPERLEIFVEGKYNVKIDGQLLEGTPSSFVAPAGKHKIDIKVYSLSTVPAIYVKGSTIVSDTSWLLTFEDKEWIDETGKTSDISATKWVNAGCENFNDPLYPPSHFKLKTTPESAASVANHGNTSFLDFGKETLRKNKI